MDYLAILFNKNPLYEKCPSCGIAGTLHRSRVRSILEKLIKSLTFYKIYRCKNCGWRGYRSLIRFTFRSAKSIALYIILIIIVALIIRFILKSYQWGL